MPAPAQTLSIDWTGQRTDRNDRKIAPGEVTSLINYRRALGGQLDKRLGWQKTVIDTFHGGTYEGPAVELIQADTAIWRDSGQQIWAVDPATGEAYFRGESLRCFPSWHELSDELYFTHKPLSVLRGTDLWSFSLGWLDAAQTQPAYQVTILNPVTKTVKRETFTVSTPGIAAYAVTVDSSDNVWLLYVKGDTQIVLHKYDTPESSATVGVYATQAGAVFAAVDAKAIPGSGYVAVVALSSDGSTTSGVYRSYAAIAGMVASGSYYSTSGASGFTTGISILEWPWGGSAPAADGFVHFAYYDNGALKLEKFPQLAPASTVITTLAAAPSLSTDFGIGCIGGCVAVNGDRKVVATLAGVFGSDNTIDSKDRLIITPYSFDGTTVTVGTPHRSAYVASKPFCIGGVYYYLSGFDDDTHDGTGPHAGHTEGIQNGFFVRRMVDGKIMSTVLDGDAGVAFHGSIGRFGYHYGAISDSHVVTLWPVGEKVYGSLLDAGEIITSQNPVALTIDFDPDFFSSAPGIVAGGVPASVTSLDEVQELSPIHFPYNDFTVLETGASTISVNYVVIRYRIVDAIGRERLSAPTAITASPTTFRSGGSTIFTLRVPTLRHVIADRAEIVIYGSPNGSSAGDIFRQASAPNDPTVDTVDVTITPELWNDGGERLDTIGGGIEQASLSPARLAWTVGTRLFLGPLPDGSVWASLERIPGRGYEFNEVGNFESPAEAGTLIAGVDLDGSSFALFYENGIYIATGPGPDGRGGGGYVLNRVQTTKTAASPWAVARGPLGVYFQNRADGRRCLLSGGAVSEINDGAEGYRDLVASATVDSRSERAMRWFCDTGGHAYLDYGHPLPEQAAGEWGLHEGDGLPVAVDARDINGALVLLEAGDASVARLWSPSAGVTDADFLDDGVAVLTDLVTGRIAGAGFQNEFDTDWLTLSGEYMGGASTYTVTLTDGRGATEDHVITATTEDDITMRTGRFRTREVRVRIRETSATGRGRRFDGLALDVRAYGRTKRPYRQVG